MKTYRHWSGAFEIDHPPEWSLKSGATEISIWNEKGGGAVTVSTYKRKDSASTGARDHLTRFAGQLGAATRELEGDAERAAATLVDPEGTKWLLRVHVFGVYLVVATYNGAKPAEAVAILDSIRGS